MRIASCSREAMLHMNTTDSPGEPGQWTVVRIAPGGGARPLPAQAGPGARCTRAGGLPLAKSGRFSWEML